MAVCVFLMPHDNQYRDLMPLMAWTAAVPFSAGGTRMPAVSEASNRDDQRGNRRRECHWQASA